MFLAKKITKFQNIQAPACKKDSQQSKKKLTRCRFVEIPKPAKLSCPYSLYYFFGDMIFMEFKGNLLFELSLLNQIKCSQDVTINQIYDQKLISIKLSQRTDKEFAPWNDLIDQLNQSDSQGLKDWATTIKTYCSKYSKVMQRQSRKKMKSEPRKKFFSQVTEESELQKEILFKTYPCFQLKYRLKNHHNQLKEVLFSEHFITELGHSADSFVLSVLEEGLPQLLPYENPLGSIVYKILLENYFTIGDTGSKILDLESILLMKSGFGKNIKFETYFLMNYETNTFGMDIIFALTAAGEPFVVPKDLMIQPLNTDFLQKMSVKEEEIDYFVSSFYNHVFQKKYTDLDKICSIKELDFDKNEDNKDNILNDKPEGQDP